MSHDTIAREGNVALRYTIRDYDGQFDWTLSNGDESDELFDSVEDAVRDVESRYS